MEIKSRIDLAKYFNKLGFKVGAEVGVADGRYSETLCKSIPDINLHCIDPYEPYNIRNKEKQEQAFAKAQKRLSNYIIDWVLEESLSASKLYADNYFDFVFIDGDHRFDVVMMDIIAWYPKVRKGGILAGHDYYHFTDSGVVEAVNIFTQVHRIELNVISRSGNVNLRKDDRMACWWIVKK